MTLIYCLDGMEFDCLDYKLICLLQNVSCSTVHTLLNIERVYSHSRSGNWREKEKASKLHRYGPNSVICQKSVPFPRQKKSARDQSTSAPWWVRFTSAELQMGSRISGQGVHYGRKKTIRSTIRRNVSVCARKRCAFSQVLVDPPPPLLTYPMPRFCTIQYNILILLYCTVQCWSDPIRTRGSDRSFSLKHSGLQIVLCGSPSLRVRLLKTAETDTKSSRNEQFAACHAVWSGESVPVISSSAQLPQ